MRATENFRRQHAELIEILDQLAQLLDTDAILKDASDVKRVVTSLGVKLSIHHSLEDDYLYPRLIESPFKSLSFIARTYQQEFSSNSDRFNAFCERWKSRADIQQNVVDFIRQSKQTIKELRFRISREETTLYDEFDKLSPQDALKVLTAPTPAPPTSRTPANSP
jgi:hypothetical protein